MAIITRRLSAKHPDTSGSCVNGKITAPPSKSLLHRMIICAALSDGESEICNYFPCDDVEATVDAVISLGATVERHGDTLCVSPCGKLDLGKNIEIDCRESGSTARFIAPVAAALGIGFSLIGEGRLPERPMDEYIRLFGDSGLDVKTYPKEGESTAEKRAFFTCAGKLSGRHFTVSSDVSSQFMTGLLLAATVIGGEVVFEFKGEPKSKGYIDMTLDILREFGVKASRDGKVISVSGKCHGGIYTANGDMSGAAFPLCAGAIFGKVTVCGLNSASSASTQGDAEILGLLSRFGASVVTDGDSVTVQNIGRLCGISIDAENIPDLVPPIAAVGAFAKGKTVISGIERLKYKESNRISAIVTALSGIGADIRYDGDRLIIYGREKLCGGTQDSFCDHRIAMMCAVASLGCENGVILTNSEVTGKSYPEFYKDFEKIGGMSNVINLG